MFNDPNTSSFPEIEDGRYILRVLRIEDAEPGQYGPRIRWVFLMWDQAGEQVCWDNGEPFEWFRLTSTKTGQKSTARKWLQAFLNRELTPDDTGAALAEQVIGRTAVAMIAVNDDGYPDIANIKPHVKQEKAAAPAQAAPAKPRAASPRQQPVAAGGGAALDALGDDEPF